MYPFLRLAAGLARHRGGPDMDPFDVHVSRHLCWPWDLDPWVELNNGRTLTLFDIGRVVLAKRTGLLALLRRRRWGLAVAGASVRYRRRIHLFDRFEMHTRVLGWDDRFLYVEQALWRPGICASHLLVRVAVTGPKGIVAPAQVTRALGLDPVSPDLPDWVRAWIAADATRPWPPDLPPIGDAIAGGPPRGPA